MNDRPGRIMMSKTERKSMTATCAIVEKIEKSEKRRDL